MIVDSGWIRSPAGYASALPSLWGASLWHLMEGIESRGSLLGPQSFAEITARHAECGVLVVDDDLAIRETVTALLEDEGFLVAQAANGAEALECLEQQLPHVVLLDMRMPILDGWGFVTELRKRNVDVKVVAMTATHDVKRWAQEIGATSYLGKPFGADELLSLLERLCED